MRHSKAEKAETHKHIVAIASKRFREEGLAGIGIADLMKEAGLTVGGLYKHFKSREPLVAEAVASALGLWKRQVDAAASGGPPVTYESLVDDYLSEKHRNHPGTGCPVDALAGDIARSDKRTRAIATRQIRDHIELVATLIRDTNEKDKGTARSKAVLTYCVLVGAIGVARVVSDEQLSREILKTAARAPEESRFVESLRGIIAANTRIMFGSFLASHWSSDNQSLLGSRSRHGYAITWNRWRKLPGTTRIPVRTQALLTRRTTGSAHRHTERPCISEAMR